MWSGNLTFEEDKVITLNDSLAKYKYLDFYANFAGDSPILTFPTTNTYFLIKLHNTVNNLDTISINYEELSLSKVSDTQLKIDNDSWIHWYWNGKSTDSATKGRAAGNIYKIIGRRI